MTRRIFNSIFLVALAVFLACLAVIMGVVYEHSSAVQREQLLSQTELAAQGVELEGERYFDGLRSENFRITWVAADGTVLYDTERDASTMVNHASREEIEQALATGYGESSHESETLMERQMYSAKRLSNGTVVRVSCEEYTVAMFLLLMIQPILLVLVLAAALALFLAYRLSKQVVQPLNSLNLDDPLSNDTYEELTPLLARIEHLHRQVSSQMADMRRKQEEFDAVTGSMSEGLLLLNAQGDILSINGSAAKLLNTDRSCLGKNILTVDRSLDIQELLRRARGGEQAEAIVPLGGGSYQLSASPVRSDGAVSGTALLMFDVTEKAGAEELRREFTANVSHELKTPLHSISGCAELLKDGLVRPEDVQGFDDQIYFEAQRMIRLVDDIIRLSRLDEGAEGMLREKTDLYALAGDAVKSLAPAAAAKNVTVSLEGEGAVMEGIPQLLTGIVYNLCDNAIKYNVDGGRVDVSVRGDGERVTLRVADTGIGIAPEHRARVFERFYRVDKSHSREIGGTGLGLSIVKHAARLHNAAVSLESDVGKGTAITVTFPRCP